MDSTNLTPLVGFGILWTIISVSGAKVPPGDKVPPVDDLSVRILDENVLLHWKQPVGDPSNMTYNVQLAQFVSEWKNVSSCSGITNTQCDLTSYIEDYRKIHKVRVQTVKNKRVSQWTMKKVTLYDSKLSPPTFNVWTSSSSLTLYVVPKPVLREIFAFGVTYTIHLVERGQEDKNITVYLEDGQTVKTFPNLRWGVEYCVSVKVEGKGGRVGSSFSPQHCQRLPEQEWFVIAVASLTTAGVLMLVIVAVLILLCYLKRPRQTPAALKSPVSGWHPLSVAEARIEVVTDKGWFLSSNRPTAGITRDLERLPAEKREGDEEELRRKSLDSGVCMESNSSAGRRRQEDSGCESSSTSETLFHPPGGTDTDPRGGGFHLPFSGLTTDGNYRSQKPSAHKNTMFKHMVPHSLLPKVGFGSEPHVCLCFGAGQCALCLKQRLLEVSSCNQPAEITPHFFQPDTMLAGRAEFGQSFPLLTSLCSQKDLNMNDVSLSICDVQMTTD
ncbi:interleukin-10 receptor subunit alpha [Synchiropus picturatus]